METLKSYTRKVHYHETDKMGIAHHSNYIKWMEETRVAFLEAAGAPFELIESHGIVSPVVGLSVEYKLPCTFGDEVVIDAKITSYNGIRLEVAYEMKNAHTGEVLATAASKHCFTKDGRICSLKKACPDIHARIEAAAA